ncbi:hypothetical protein QP166_18695 [Sphingomonas sp. LR60]|uniref:hypothetical protein n=1 Tax=Sphingomonas sp. LR60 TaxID=3050233 RepID=UPI002FE1D343
MTYFDQLQASGAAKRSALLAATVDVRKGRCLLEGSRAAEGRAAIARGLPLLREKGESFAGDVYDAQMALGRRAQRDFDYAAAASAYVDAAAQLKDAARIPALLRVAQVTMFDHDGRALAATDEALRLASASELGKKDLAAVQTIRARVLLNDGRAKDAYALLKDSLAKQGGLTSRVGASDIATRSDLAIAALKNKDRDNARMYLAYTGAGRVQNTPFTTSASMAPPSCGDGGLTPEDEAIVEFTLEEDGHVSGVAPIYTNGGREKAIAFARAVADWSWRPEDARKIPALFRYTTRVELRCVTADRAPALTAPLGEIATAWLAEKGRGRRPGRSCPPPRRCRCNAPRWRRRPRAAIARNRRRRRSRWSTIRSPTTRKSRRWSPRRAARSMRSARPCRCAASSRFSRASPVPTGSTGSGRGCVPC